MVKPQEVDDDRAQIMAREIAKRLHAEASYAGPHQGGRAQRDPERRVRQVTVEARVPVAPP